jgi:hypothetical protein
VGAGSHWKEVDLTDMIKLSHKRINKGEAVNDRDYIQNSPFFRKRSSTMMALIVKILGTKKFLLQILRIINLTYFPIVVSVATPEMKTRRKTRPQSCS